MKVFQCQVRLRRRRTPLGEWLGVVGLCFLFAQGVQAQDRGVSAVVVGSGGGRSYASPTNDTALGRIGASIANDAVIGGIGGVTFIDSPGRPAVANRTSYAGQLTDIVRINLSASPAVLHPFETTQLTGVADLDDGTYWELLGSEIQWEPAEFPLVSLTPDGRAAAPGSITQDMASAGALVHGRFLGTDASYFLRLQTDFPPRIRPMPAEQTATNGATIGLVATIDAADCDQPEAEPLTIEWYWNDILIRGATESVLRLPRLEVRDSGTYSIRVKNCNGFAEAHTYLTVVPATEGPTLTTLPVDVTGNLDGDITLSVRATGTRPLYFQWQLNGDNLVDRPVAGDPADLTARGELEGSTSDTLTIRRLRLADAGTYTVLVENGLGATVSSPVTLSFAGLRVLPFTTNQPPFQNVASLAPNGGSGVFLERLANPVWVKWQAPAAGYASFTTAGSGFDTFIEAEEYDEGGPSKVRDKDDDFGGFHTSLIGFNVKPATDYYIKVSNYAVQSAGISAVSGDILLQWSFQATKQPRPEFLTNLVSRSVLLGPDATFPATNLTFSATVANANAGGTSFDWYFEGRPLRSGGPVPSNIHTFQLTLTNVGVAQIGHYQLIASNSNWAQNIFSDIASLEASTETNLFVSPKFEQLFDNVVTHEPARSALRLNPMASQVARLRQANGRVVPASVSVGQGIIGSQIASNFGAGTQPQDTITDTNGYTHIIYNSVWLEVDVTQNCEIFFRGSTIGAAGPSGSNSDAANLYVGLFDSQVLPITFDVSRATHQYGKRPSIALSAKANDVYYVKLATLDSVSTNVVLNWETQIPGFQWVKLAPVGQSQTVRIEHADSGISDVATIYYLDSPEPTKASDLFQLDTFEQNAAKSETRFQAQADYYYWIGAVAPVGASIPSIKWFPEVAFRLSNGTLILNWGESSDRSFALQYSDRFAASGWKSIDDPGPREGILRTEGTKRTFEVQPNASPRYYRLVPNP